MVSIVVVVFSGMTGITWVTGMWVVGAKSMVRIVRMVVVVGIVITPVETMMYIVGMIVIRTIVP